MANPVTHLEKTIAGKVSPVTHLEKVIAEYGGGNVYENLEAGTNILIEETADGKAKISASGEVSSEDTVARAEIAAIKNGTNIDSFGDVETALIGKADTTDIPTVPITAIQKNGTGITPVSGTVNITVPTTAADVSALPDTTKYAAALSLTINSSTFVMTGQLKDQNGDNLGTAQTIDLPLESVVVDGSYNSQTKKVVLTLQNGNTIEFSVADLVSGLQTELSASNKLNPAYINYDSTHAAVTEAQRDQIETNKNNILSVANTGRKNVLHYNNNSTSSANGVVYTINSNGSITADVSGKAGLSYIILMLNSSNVDVKPYCTGNYILTGCPSGGGDSTYQMYAASGSYVKRDYGDGVVLAETEQANIYLIIRIEASYSGANITFKPMIRLVGTDSTFEKWSPSNAELYDMILALQ